MTLSKGQEMHLQSLSLDNYISHVNSEFITYASCSGFRLGKINQRYTVLDKNSEVMFASLYAKDAFDKYIESIKQITK